MRRGTGLEFADYRQYVAGDDFRHLDWKAYLRLNRLILRLFEEEEDLPIYMFLDSSQSMNYGDPTKFDYGRRVAAALCYIGLSNLDRVNVIPYADKVKGELRPNAERDESSECFDFLKRSLPGARPMLASRSRPTARETRRRGLAVVISDFFDASGFQTGLDILRHFKHDIFVASHCKP